MSRETNNMTFWIVIGTVLMYVMFFIYVFITIF